MQLLSGNEENMSAINRWLIIITIFLIWNTLNAAIYYFLRLNILFDLNLVLLILIIYVNNLLQKNKQLNTLSKQFIVAIFSLLFIDIVGIAIYEEEYEYVGKDITLRDISTIRSDTKAGYLLNDGSYNLNVKILKEDREISSYESNYNIKNSKRIVGNESANNCISIILIGGSHNFGQSIPDNQTLQYLLNENGLNTLNFSVPGYGLVHSYALLNEEGVFEDNLNICVNSYIVYRFITDHINRDNGKTFFSPYSSHIIGDGPSIEIQQNFTNLVSGSIYLLTKYLPTRVFSYSANETAEITFRILMQPLQRYWFYTDDDIKRSSYLLKKISSKLKETNGKSKIILLIDDNMNTFIRKYLAEIEDLEDISIITSLDSSEFMEWGKLNCQNIRYKEEKFIPLEGHPTGCLNKYYGEKILELL